MAATKHSGDEPASKPARDDDPRDRAAREASRQREQLVAKTVLGITGVPHHYSTVRSTEVGPGRYRVSLLVRVAAAGEFLDDTKILHSWYVLMNADLSAVAQAMGDVPLRELYPD